MQKLMFVLAAVLMMAAPASAQKYFTRDGKIKFTSDTPLEKIEGTNKSATCVLDTKTGKMEWKVLVKGFLFEKALLQEHFNENYMESSKYPNATFKGEITNLSDINFAQEGKYNAKVKGKLTMHGVEKEIMVNGTIKVAGGNITMNSTFDVACADYNIDIPSVVADKIAKSIKIVVDATLKPL